MRIKNLLSILLVLPFLWSCQEDDIEDIFQPKAKGKKAAISEFDDENFYGDEGFNEDEFDDESFSDLSFDDDINSY